MGWPRARPSQVREPAGFGSAPGISVAQAAAAVWAADTAWRQSSRRQAEKRLTAVAVSQDRFGGCGIRPRFDSQLILRYRIVASAREGIATQHAPAGQSRSVKKSMMSYGLGCVFRAAGHETASGREHRRNQALIQFQRERRRLLHRALPFWIA